MKSLFALLAVGALLFGISGLAQADESSNATSHVFVEVDPNIAVVSADPHVDMGNIQTGMIDGYVPYRIDANTQTVKFQAGASLLFKGDDPDEPDVLPIELLLDAGISISCADANPTGGEDGVCDYTGETVIDGFPGWDTEWVEFESSQNNHFSQECELHVVWNQDDDEKPMGEYSGKVELWGMIVLPG